MNIYIILVVILVLVFVGYKYHLDKIKKRQAEEIAMDAKYKKIAHRVDVYPSGHKLFRDHRAPRPEDIIKHQPNLDEYIKVPTKFDCMRKCDAAPTQEVKCYPKTKEFENCLNSSANDCYSRFNHTNMYDYTAAPYTVNVGCNSYQFTTETKRPNEPGQCSIYRSCPDRMDEFKFHETPKTHGVAIEFGYIRDKVINFILSFYSSPRDDYEKAANICKKYCDDTKGCKSGNLIKEPAGNADAGGYHECSLTF